MALSRSYRFPCRNRSRPFVVAFPAKALGIIPARQATLDLTGETPNSRQTARRPVATTLYLHLSLADAVAGGLTGDPGVGEAERLGPLTADLVRTWLQDSEATIRPVLDLDRADAVDRHVPPPRQLPVDQPPRPDRELELRETDRGNRGGAMQNAERAVLVDGLEDILELAGRSLGPSDWVDVTQGNVDAFARSVHDWHWAHNEPDRAARGPFGSPIAHAHMTLAVIPHLRETLLTFASGECMFYGYNRVRFPTVVPVGARVRMRATVVQAEEVGGGAQLTLDLRVEVEGQDRPGCVAQAIWRHYDIEPPA